MWKKQAIRNSFPRYAALAAVLLAGLVAELVAQEAELLQVLRSDTSVQEKSTACRQLARVATKDSVATLAGLLSDETLSHMARYAMERIEDPAVDDALRAALEKVPSRQRLGVIGSLGVRRDAKAVEPLASLLQDADTETVQAAARALGSIGTPQAAKALEGVLTNSRGQNQLAVCEGLFRCAERMTAEQNELAQALYDHVREVTDAPHQVRAAALRGAVLTRGKDGVPLLVEAVRGPDYVLAAAAMRTAMEMPIPEVTAALVAEVPNVAPERQGLLIVALAECGATEVLPAVLEAANSDDGQLRILAFRALKRIGDASCIPALLEAAGGDNADVAQAAMESLESLQDKSANPQLTARLRDADGKDRLVLIQLAGRRRIAEATSTLWAAADDGDSTVQAAALTSLGSIIAPSELSKLVARLKDVKDQQVADALDKAVQEVCLRTPDQEAAAQQLAAALPSVDTAAKARVMSILNTIGGKTALDAVGTAVRSEDEALRDAAYQILGQWKSADAAPLLLDLHNSLDDSRLKVRAIRAYIRIARQFDMPAEQRVEMCRTALKLAQREADKRLVLEVLLRFPSDEMQQIALEAAEDPALKDQALLVVMGMASQGVNRAELGRALAQAGQKPVELEIVKAEYGAGDKVKDVTAALRICQELSHHLSA